MGSIVIPIGLTGSNWRFPIKAALGSFDKVINPACSRTLDCARKVPASRNQTTINLGVFCLAMMGIARTFRTARRAAALGHISTYAHVTATTASAL